MRSVLVPVKVPLLKAVGSSSIHVRRRKDKRKNCQKRGILSEKNW
jgi:hypothetical protein